jgi:hypothetical protein
MIAAYVDDGSRFGIDDCLRYGYGFRLEAGMDALLSG